MSAALRHWMSCAETTAYVIGGPIGPHPFPTMVGAFEAVVGRETRMQLLEAGLAPQAIVSAVGGGASTLGLFKAFVGDPQITLLAVEAGGDGEGPHAARLARGRRGILHGAETLVLSDDNGNIAETASIAPGLAYPGSAPELASLVKRGRVVLACIGDVAARDAVLRLAASEGFLVSLEAGHALAAGLEFARQARSSDVVVVMVPSSGEKDLDALKSEVRHDATTRGGQSHRRAPGGAAAPTAEGFRHLPRRELSRRRRDARSHAAPGAERSDVIEVGYPFSDPILDGAVIQAMNRKAVSAGGTLARTIDLCTAFRADDSSTPLILMGYANPIATMGYGEFARRAAAAASTASSSATCRCAKPRRSRQSSA